MDTTLREGEQTPYVNFTIDEKLHIARLLDQIGVDMIEAVTEDMGGRLTTNQMTEQIILSLQKSYERNTQ